MNRRGLIAALFPSAVVLGANAPLMAASPTLGEGRGRLFKPKIGPVLEAWIAEKPDVRSADVEVKWERGQLFVSASESVGDGTFPVRQCRYCDESSPGSFTVCDDVAKEVIECLSKEVERRVVKLRAELEAAIPAPPITREQWASLRGDDRDIMPDKVVGRQCFCAIQVDQDVVYCTALWSPKEPGGNWHVYPTNWSVSNFIHAACYDQNDFGVIYLDGWNSQSIAAELAKFGIDVRYVGWARSIRAAGVNFIRSLISSGTFRHCGPAISECALKESLANCRVGSDGIFRDEPAARSLIMAASVAASAAGVVA